jgi:hypothetical protein
LLAGGGGAHARGPCPLSVADGARVRGTRHCLTGCAIGEITGTLVSAALALSTATAMVLGIVLAFLFGYGLTFVPLLRSGVPLGRAVPLTLAADTVSIVVMEAVDNLFVLLVPGAMDAGVTDVLFWGSLVVGLAIAFVITLPVNRWLIVRGEGHARAHTH